MHDHIKPVEKRLLGIVNDNLKISLGIKIQISKSLPPTKEELEEELKTGIKIIPKREYKDHIAKSLILTINTKKDIKRQVASMYDDLKDKLITFEQNIMVSVWRFEKVYNIFVETFKIRPVRGSSYIPTPEKFINPKCGLINIHNEDNECFKWCMKYHQSSMDNNSRRITALSKIDDKYDYTNVNFPATHEDIRTFECNNKLSVFVYYINEKDEVMKEKSGECEYATNGIIYLLRIEEGEKNHYIYIKHISHLLNLATHITDKDKKKLSNM